MADYAWLKNYDEGVPHSLKPYPDHTLLDVIAENARQRPGHTMIWFKGNTISYGRFAALVDTLAKALAGVGVKKGDRVALIMPNCPQIIIGQFAIWKAGGITAQVNPLYSEDELIHALKDSGSETVIVLSTFYNQVKKVQARAGVKTVIATSIKEYLSPFMRALAPYGISALYAAPPRAPVSSSGRAARNTGSSTFPATPTAGCSEGTRTGGGRSGCRSTRLIVRGLLNLYGFYGDDFKVECPTGSGNGMNLFDIAKEISRRLSGIFLATGTAACGALRSSRIPGRPALARSDPLLRVLPRRQRGRPRCRPPDRVDRPHRAPARHLRTRDRRRTRWRTPRRSSRLAWCGSRWAAKWARTREGEPCPHLISRALPGQHARPALGARGRRWGARRRSTTSRTRSSTGWPRTGSTWSGSSASGRRARRPGACRVEARVARRVPPRAARLPRGRRLRLLLRGPGLPGPRGLRRGRGARPAPHPPEAPRPAADPRFRPEPHGAGPPVGERAPGLLRGGDRGAARRAAAELLPRGRRERARASSRTGAIPTSTAGRTRSS